MGGRGSASVTSYGVEHRPGNPLEYPDEVATIDQITSGDIFPSDFLDHPEWYLLSASQRANEPGAMQTLEVLRSVQGRPDAEVTIYRGAPYPTFNTGDWVSLSSDYASLYTGDDGYNGPGGKLYSTTVKASELSFDGDHISEFGYWGARKKGTRA